MRRQRCVINPTWGAIGGPSRAPSVQAIGLYMSMTCMAWAGPKTPPEIPLDIQADNLILDHKKGTARFDGHVVARQGDFELMCQQINARYTEGGRLAHIDAEGGVVVKGEGLLARAKRATYDHKAGVLELTGEPRLEREGAHLTGERIRYWPEGGRVEVIRARGQFKAPALSRWTPKGGGL